MGVRNNARQTRWQTHHGRPTGLTGLTGRSIGKERTRSRREGILIGTEGTRRFAEVRGGFAEVSKKAAEGGWRFAEPPRRFLDPEIDLRGGSLTLKSTSKP